MFQLPMTLESIHKNVVAYLRTTGSQKLADIVSSSIFEASNGVQYQGSQRVGIIICCRCPQQHLSQFETASPFGFAPTKSEDCGVLQRAIDAILPAGFCVHKLDIRARLIEQVPDGNEYLLQRIGSLKDIMIAVATGVRIQEKNQEYLELKAEVAELLSKAGFSDPNNFSDLWSWYGRWSDGTLPRYQDRRAFIASLYQPLIDNIKLANNPAITAPVDEPTGWERVDRVWLKIKKQMATAANEEDFQAIGHQCREIMISVAQMVYDANLHPCQDGVSPSKTDAKRMIEAYINYALPGSSNDELRRHVKTTFDLANAVQHRRTASKRDASICMEATRTTINLIQIIENS